MKKNHPLKKWTLKSISQAVRNQIYKSSVAITGIFLCSHLMLPTAVHASDLEIYRQGNPDSERTIMLMLDTSRNMGGAALIDLLKEYPICVGGGVTGLTGELTGVKDAELINVVNTLIDEVVDDVVLEGLLGGSLDSILSVKVDQPGSSTNPKPYERAYCTVVLTDAVANVLQGLLGGLGLGAKEYIQATCEQQTQINVLTGALAGVGIYRCYDKLSQMKDAVYDVVFGNNEKGIAALPENTQVGISVFPTTGTAATRNDNAGQILVPAAPLDEQQKQLILNALIDLKLNSDFNLKNLLNNLLSAEGVLSSLVGDVLGGVIGLLKNPISGLGDLLRPDSTAGAVNDLLETLGLAGNTPTASVYAETVAYLKGQTTKGTGAREVYRISRLLIVPVYEKCTQFASVRENFACTNWETVWNPVADFPSEAERNQRGMIEVNDGILKGALGDLLGLGTLVDGILSILYQQKSYYEFKSEYDSIYSGYSHAPSIVKDNNKYISPVSQQSCPMGIFVLTGSVPNLSPTAIDTILASKNQSTTLGAQDGIQRLMRKSLNSSNFSCTTSAGTTGLTLTKQDKIDYANWECIGSYANELVTNHNIRTSVVGVGRDFMSVPSAMNLQDLDFSQLDKNQTLVGNAVPSAVGGLLTGLSGGTGLLAGVNGLLGNLFPIQKQDVKNMAYWGVIGGGGWHYMANTQSISNSIHNFSNNLVESKEPNVGIYHIPADRLDPYLLENFTYEQGFEATNKQSWFGNLKKYNIDANGAISTPIWGNEKDTLFEGGVIEKLPQIRNIYINRSYDTEEKGYQASESNLQKFCNANIANNCIETNKVDIYRKDILAVLGYKVQFNAQGTQELMPPVFEKGAQRIGMPYHSTPLKITSSAIFSTVLENGIPRQKLQREDYLVFGSTQGLLHVIDANTGEEKMAFLPQEMLENEKQRRALTGQNLADYGGQFTQMQYGIDGPWEAYTEYTTSTESNKRTISTVGGKQWLYGGLRMGGTSYYALDLTNIDTPSIKFHINPAAAQENDPLSYMGQSWSKPTIARVNWQGSPRLVMLVGGGYDVRYESATYSTGGTSVDKGAGIYMFDADNGELLWWGGSQAENSSSSSQISEMRHSIVSRINALDRDSDGLADHLYFADLGGQVWRIDLNKAMQLVDTTNASDITQNTFILNSHLLFKTAHSQRFYEAPTFSVYGHGNKTKALLSIAASNRSLPISDPISGNIYNIFDNEVVKVNPTSSTTLVESDLTPYENIQELSSVGLSQTLLQQQTYRDLTQKGWYVPLADSKKVMGELSVVNKNLYASVYDPKAGEIAECSVGTLGETSIHRYCLPYGICETGAPATKSNEVLKMGKGILPLNIGGGAAGSPAIRQVIGGQNRKEEQEGISNQEVMRRQIVPLNWYERHEK